MMMTEEERKLMDEVLLLAVREFLFMALVWNDHNFREGVVTEKCRELCMEKMDIKTVEEANEFLDYIKGRLGID